MKSPIPENVDDVVELRVGLLAAEAEDRGVEVDVLAAGEVGVEARAELEQRGERDRAARTVPEVGSMMPPMTFSSVLLPEPLWPMRPIVLPAWMSRLTSLQRPEVLTVRAAGAAEGDDALLEGVVLADGEALGDVVDLDDRRGRDGFRRPSSVMRRHHSSCAKLPCRRRNTRWLTKRRTRPMTSAIDQAQQQVGRAGGGRLRPPRTRAGSRGPPASAGCSCRSRAAPGSRSSDCDHLPRVDDRRRPEQQHRADLDEVLHVAQVDVEQRRSSSANARP